VPEEIRDELMIHCVESIDDVLKLALEDSTEKIDINVNAIPLWENNRPPMEIRSISE
jgi:predicted ATP-dependent protease